MNLGQAANKTQRDLQISVGQRETPGNGIDVGILAPFKSMSAADISLMYALLAAIGKGDGLSQTQEQQLKALIEKYVGEGNKDPRYPSLNAKEKVLMYNLVAVRGREGFTVDQEKVLKDLVQRWVYNGGEDPTIPIDSPQENGEPVYPSSPLSFATKTIDNAWDAIDFLKVAMLMSLAASLNPSLIIPTQVCLVGSFIYATRKQITKLFYHGSN